MSHGFANCPRCGAPVVESDRLCFACGQVLEEAGRPTPPVDAPPATEPPAAGAPDVRRVWTAGTQAPPWEERERHGFLAALWLTWRDSVFRPVPFFRSLPPRSGLGPAIGYTLIVTAIAICFSVYWETVRTVLSGGADEGVAVTLLGGLLSLLLLGGLMLGVYLGLLFVTVAIMHLGFMVAGAGRMGYEATFRATCYASGPAAFAVFPFFGPIIGMVWGSVILFVAMREVQRTTNGRAALAFLIPLLAFSFLVMLIAVLFALVIGASELTAS